MKKKVLFVATVLRGHVWVFHLPYMQWFESQGYEVHVACSNDTEEEVLTLPHCTKYFNLPFARSPFNSDNIKVYKTLSKLIDKEEYSLIHCHTPVGGLIGRLAARKARKKGTKVVYTAHGFHFYKGASIKNWLLYYPAERYLSRYTDLLVTINQEDYNHAKNFHAKKVVLVQGIGVALPPFEKSFDKVALRNSLALKEDWQLAITVGEHSIRKNHAVLLHAINKNKNYHLLLCGVGEEKTNLINLAKELQIEDRVHFLGFRKDVQQVLQLCNVFLFPSLHEGLPLSLMEAMAAGLPIIASDVRGNRDLVIPQKGGYLVNPTDANAIATNLNYLLENPTLAKNMGIFNKEKIKDYSLENILKHMATLYNELLGS